MNEKMLFSRLLFVKPESLCCSILCVLVHERGGGGCTLPNRLARIQHLPSRDLRV